MNMEQNTKTNWFDNLSNKDALLILNHRMGRKEHADDIEAALDVARKALETVIEFENQGVTFETVMNTQCDLAGAEGEIDKLNFKVYVMTRLLNGEWVETEDVCEALELSFTEAFKLFDFSRTAEWWSIVGKTEEERSRNGQCIKTEFRIKQTELERYKAIGSHFEFERLKRHLDPVPGVEVQDTIKPEIMCQCCSTIYAKENYETYKFCPECGTRFK